ncbi:MAG: 2-amino-4-hydroxy-6-hydroxymethyldihydropteridine diphosphokinase [Candidatus Kapabacteria bacterium]|nr:2-amino-4-hydroxy-6-hydroxymethyldihydropteridine diphosphokinase [Ignavibacteriota bacterium]MCW5883592.1 2-amino-4-hydroxy-6-hydroxymethyldihydropteridine diphosphokinase [Candidatus Kapabacteria bacterium]
MKNNTDTPVLLSLGSNLGDRYDNIITAIKLFKESELISDISISSFYESEPFGYENQPWFLNVSLIGKTSYSAEEILYFAKSIEYISGRQKREHWHEREIDIDIILHGENVVNDKKLILPHPYFSKRKFVLMPTVEIAGSLRDPLSNKTITKLLEECEDKSQVKLYSALAS